MAEYVVNLLLVEDDEDDAVLVTSTLRDVPGVTYKVEWVRDIEGGAERLRAGGFDAALIDYRIGPRTGLELIQDAVRAGVRTPLILLTGQTEGLLDLDALGAGASDFLDKRLITADLLERSIRYSVQRKKSEQDRVRLIQEQAARERAEATAAAVRDYARDLEVEISERKRAETELRASEERFRQLANAMPQIVWAADGRGRLAYVNHRWSEYTGLAPDDPEFAGIHTSAIHPEEAELALHRWEQATRDGTVYQVEIRLRRKDGAYRWHLVRAVPVVDSHGAIERWYGTSTDIDDQKRAEQAVAEHAQRLAASNAELESFAYVASHDLKEPLRGISAYAEMLLEDLGAKAGEEDREKLQTLVKLSKRMYDLLDSLLELSRVGRMEVALGECDLNELVGGVLEGLHARLEQDKASVQVAKLPTINCDGVRTGQVFSNLIVNALKYNNKESKSVEIGSEIQDGVHVLYVRDNGIGIADRHHDAVFRVFRRLHPRDAYGGGTGMGLAIVKKIVQQHGGRIWLKSVPGEGTTFYFTLGPAASAAEFALAATPDRRIPAGREAGLIEPRRTSTVVAEPPL
jgi:PAS domain S-box-containing protein